MASPGIISPVAMLGFLNEGETDEGQTIYKCISVSGGIGFNAAPTDRMSTHLDYEFEGRSDHQSHGGSLYFL